MEEKEQIVNCGTAEKKDVKIKPETNDDYIGEVDGEKIGANKFVLLNNNRKNIKQKKNE